MRDYRGKISLYTKLKTWCFYNFTKQGRVCKKTFKIIKGRIKRGKGKVMVHPITNLIPVQPLEQPKGTIFTIDPFFVGKEKYKKFLNGE